jgi:S1-C subfamily serine protease
MHSRLIPKGLADLAVVRIQTTRQRPSWTVPWQMRSVEASSGSGSIIHGSFPGKVRVLSAAHVVADSTYITVQRNTDFFDSEKFPVKVVSMFHDTDLALLEIDDVGGDFKAIDPLAVAPADKLPTLRSKVNVVGYPVGGDRVSVTEGVVSRVDIARYSHSGRFAASFTVDAAINAGNSGGPIIDPEDGCIVGVAFQKLVGSGIENQGHGVPPFLIHRFLKSVGSERTDLSLPSLGIAIQPLESTSLREYLGASSGVLVNWSLNPELRPQDVIVAINGHKIDNNGLCFFLGRRMHFSALMHELFVGETVTLEVLRDRNMLQVNPTLVPSSSVDLVPGLQYGKRPNYIVFGGLVFQPLSLDYLQGWNERDRPPHLQDLLNRGKIGDQGRDEVLVLTNVLASKCNAGYSSGWVGGPVLKTVNGVSVRDIKQLGSLLDKVLASHEFVKLTLSGYVEDQLVVVKSSDVLAEEPVIKATYDIPRMRYLES